MGTMKFEIPHTLNKDEARKRVEQLLQYWRSKYGVQSNWSGDGIMTSRRFSLARCWAMVVKEFVQMRRDRLTFGMMIGVPLLQLVLFGFAINADPKYLPAAVLLADDGPQGRTLLEAMRNSSYFHFVRQVRTEEEAQIAEGIAYYVRQRWNEWDDLAWILREPTHWENAVGVLGLALASVLLLLLL